MELLIYCLYPFILLFMLLEWFYKKILYFVYWCMGVQDDTKPRESRENTDDDRRETEEKQRKNIEYPERIPEDKGMNPQERIIPQLPQDEKKPEPEKKTLPKPDIKPRIKGSLTPKPKPKQKPRGMEI